MTDVLCVDIGGTSTKAALLDAFGELGPVRSVATRPDVEHYFEQLASLIEASRGQCRRLGVAVAGFLDDERTRLVYNSNLSWLQEFPLRARLAARFPEMAIELEVDSNAAMMAEYQLGSGRRSRRFLCVTSGTGLGVGLAIDGVPLRFAYGCLGDIGHIVIDREGPACPCGGYGCAEMKVSAPVLAAQFAGRTNRKIGDVTLRDAIEAAQAGHAGARAILHEAGEWLGIAMACMADIFFPDHIALAGGLSAAGDLVLAPAEQTFRRSACLLARSQVTLALAALGPQATLIGAAWPFWKENYGKAVA